MKSFLIAIVWVVLGCAPRVSYAQSKWTVSDEFIHLILAERNPQTVEDFKDVADSLRRLQGADACTIQLAIKSMEISQFYRSQLDPEPGNLVRFQVSDSCQSLSARYHYQLGAILFQAGNVRGAIDEFQRSLDLTSDSTFRGDAHNNLSACYAVTELELDSALLHLELALRLLDKSQSPYILNNLTAIALRQGDWVRARSYLAQAFEWTGDAQMDLVYNLNVNQLTLELIEGNLEQAAVAFQYVLAHPPSPGNECEALRQISRYLLLSQNYASYVENYQWLQGLATPCAADERNVYAEEAIPFQPWRKRVMPSDSVEKPLDEMRWQMASWTARTLAKPPFDAHRNATIQDLTGPGQPGAEGRGLLVVWCFLGLSALLVAGFLRRGPRRDRNAMRAVLRQLDQFRRVVEAGLDHDAIQDEIDRLERTVNSGQTPPAPYWGRVDTDAELTRLEEKVLEQLALGRSSKEIAQILSISPGYVYNVRMKLRKKLNVPDDLRFEDWLEGQG